MTAATRRQGFRLPLEPRSIAVGFLSGVALLASYLIIISFAQGATHAIEQLGLDVVPIGLVSVGFGTQISLFMELRTIDRRHRASAAVTVVGTGTSTAAMLACCAHHLIDLMPILGLSAGAIFLNAYKTPLLVAGIGINLIGIVVVARQLRSARRAYAALEGAASAI